MKDSDLTTVFLCFLKSGLYFTRDDTNAVGLAFMEELKKHNSDFKPTKIEQREWNKTFMVNAFPAQFEPLIMACIEERRKSHNLQPRKERPRGGSPHRKSYGSGGHRGGHGERRFNRDRDHGQRRDGGFNRDRRFSSDRSDNRDDRNYKPRRNFASNSDHQQSYRKTGDHEEVRRPRRRRIIKPNDSNNDGRGSSEESGGGSSDSEK